MKRSMLLFVCGMLLVGFFSASLFADEQDFTVVNATGVTIGSLYVSAVTVNDWEENLLDVDTLADGESFDISFDAEEEECKWDLMVKDTEGNAIYWRDLDLCEVETLTLHYENGKAWATQE